MFEQRLVERIAAGRAGEVRISGPVDVSAILDDVLRHLRDLLNARQGSVPTRADYGMPDMNDLLHLFPDALSVLRDALLQQINLFEPRLRAVSVRHEPDADNPLRLNFTVAAELVVGGVAERVAFYTAVTDDGTVSLRS
jgi:type VI secretion system protein